MGRAPATIVLPRVTVSRTGRVILHASDGEIWHVSEAGTGPGPFSVAVPLGALLFGSEREDRWIFPAPSGWRDLAAIELEALLGAARTLRG